MERKEAINFLHEKLKKYGASIYNYRGQEFIAIANSNSDNHMAFTFGEEEFAMEFTYQTARFRYEDAEDGVIHAEKFLTEKLCAVELFLSGKPLMGGSRPTDGAKFKTVEEFACFYANGNEKIAENLLGFMKNGDVTVKIFSWSSTYNRSFEIVANGEQLSIKE